MRFGSIPAGGLGTRLQPIGFSKELAPVAGRPVIEYLIERMVESGIDKIFINSASDKTDLIKYLSDKSIYKDKLLFLVRERSGLLSGITAPSDFLRDSDEIFFGLPDTIWYPRDGFSRLVDQSGDLVLGLFDTGTPERFDSVVIDKQKKILSIEVKVDHPKTKWTWGIGKMKVKVAKALKPNALFGASVNEYCQSHPGYAVELPGSSYLDIGTPSDYELATSFVRLHENK